MISKKICMLGAFSVGKTSLVERFVHSIFNDDYLSTVGVKISKKNITLDDQVVTLILWDMEGQDLYANINTAFLRGAMGYFIVLDGLREETYPFALSLHNIIKKKIGNLPYYFLLNKADLKDEWEITATMIDTLKAQGIKILMTSAKTGMGVEEAFTLLGRDMCGE
ncbi:MAG: GTP-binding protein [Deltaproteobacteria bacterium]|nr:MAG: GTP-binding protein [Deltaproteobacteria bacterium]